MSFTFGSKREPHIEELPDIQTDKGINTDEKEWNVLKIMQFVQKNLFVKRATYQKFSYSKKRSRKEIYDLVLDGVHY